MGNRRHWNDGDTQSRTPGRRGLNYGLNEGENENTRLQKNALRSGIYDKDFNGH